MEKEKKITAPDGCEIEKVELIDGVAVVTFKEKDRELPKSWEEFFEMTGVKIPLNLDQRLIDVLRDRPTAEAVLALCKLIQLRNCYNGDWVPKCNDYTQKKYVIFFNEDELRAVETHSCENRLLIFKSSELRDEFLRNFRPLIEKLKPLYGIKPDSQQ